MFNAASRRLELSVSLGEKPLPESFWLRVRKGDDGECWEWIGSRDKDGYGSFGIYFEGRGTTARAHRLAVAHAYGVALIDGFVLDHLCNRKNCVKHLEAVSPRVNTIRARSGQCRVCGSDFDMLDYRDRRACTDCTRSRNRRKAREFRRKNPGYYDAYNKAKWAREKESRHA